MATIERQTFILATLALQPKAQATLANAPGGDARRALCRESQNGQASCMAHGSLTLPIFWLRRADQAPAS
jgi:hypothetical protein